MLISVMERFIENRRFFDRLVYGEIEKRELLKCPAKNGEFAKKLIDENHIATSFHLRNKNTNNDKLRIFENYILQMVFCSTNAFFQSAIGILHCSLLYISWNVKVILIPYRPYSDDMVYNFFTLCNQTLLFRK